MAVKSLFVFASLCWAFSSSYAQTPALDFSQARQLAHDRVDAIKVEAAETAKRESEAKSARSLHGPKIEADLGTQNARLRHNQSWSPTPPPHPHFD